DVQEIVEQGVASFEWAGAPAPVHVAEAKQHGEDVAVLHLREPAPRGAVRVAVRLGYAPFNDEATIIAGFGISSLATGMTGVRRQAGTRVTGFDRATGVVQVEGRPECF